MKNDPFCPVNIDFKTPVQIEESLLSYGDNSRVLLIVTAFMAEKIGLSGVIEKMGKKYRLAWYDRDCPNPTPRDVADAVAILSGEPPEIIFSIGGGSAIDLGKAVIALYGYIAAGNAEPGSIAGFIRSKEYTLHPLPARLIAMPTTAGTGSEVTKWATIWDDVNGKKLSIEMNALYPAKAEICVEFTMSAPKKLMLSAGLDALCHAMEAFWAKQTNPLVQDIAMAASAKVYLYLGPALKNPEDYMLRRELCRASILSGIAFSNTKTTASHSISYPLTMLHRVQHGLAAALTIRQVAAINRSAVPEISGLLGIFGGDAGFKNWIDSVCSGIQELKLSAFKIGREDIPGIAEASFTLGRMDNNPVELTVPQVEEILNEIF
jgi:alcohol dehydrogenase class IV